MKKKIIIFSAIIIAILFIIIFSIYYYKTTKNGNTMISKSEEDILESILNMKAYTAKMNITIQTNKNTSEYIVKQNVDGVASRQEIIEPKNIAGIITEYDGKNLKIINNKLELSTTFENYKYMVENRLWLNSFIQEYKDNDNSKKSVNENNEIILEFKKDNEIYNVYEQLFIDKKSAKPTKLVIQDINQKTVVYILYTEITFSK